MRHLGGNQQDPDVLALIHCSMLPLYTIVGSGSYCHALSNLRVFVQADPCLSYCLGLSLNTKS